MLSRRTLLARGLATGGLLFPGSGFVSSLAIARSAGERRFIFIIQRGGADGLSTLAPTGDPHFAALRGRIAGETAGGMKLDSTFTLHPSLSHLGELYRAGRALFIHATGSPYHDRSHFDGQNVLETGGPRPYAVRTGWLHRFSGLLPGHGDREVAMSNAVPLVLRGGSDVLTVGPDALPPVSEDLLAAVSQLYEADAVLQPVWDRALASRHLLDGLDEPVAARRLGRTAGELLGEGQSGRIAVIETGGWDTHAQQVTRLAQQLARLDHTIAGLEDGLGAAWDQTAVLIASEFGRTAAVNGTNGTDHGSGGLAMLLGGAVEGGRILSDWPGLAPAALHQNRDLRATTDLFGFIATALGKHFGMDPQRIAKVLFPDTGARALKSVFA